MTPLYVIFLITGLVFFFGSFLFVQHLSPSDMEELKKIGDEEIKLLIEKKFREKENEVSSSLDEKYEKKMDEFERDVSLITNEKIMQIQDFTKEVKDDTDTYLDTVQKSHKEIIFMHDMLNNKQENMDALVQEMKKEESTLRFLKDSVTDLVKDLKDEKADITGFEEFKRRQEEEPLEQGFTKEEFLSMKEELERRVLEENKTSDENKKGMSRKDRKERNDEILTLQEQGYSEVEIAKRLGIGLGEVKLVLGVFQ